MTIESSAQTTLRVVFVTTWGSECGIATYSEDLSAWLVDEGVQLSVLAPCEAGTCMARTRADIPHNAIWTRKEANLGALLTKYTEGIDIVHFQHEHGIFQNVAAFFQALTDLRKAGRKTVVTMHTVQPYGDWQGTGFADSLRSRVDCIIVHTPACLAALSLARGDAPVVWVPHGTRVAPPAGTREEGLKFLTIPEPAWQGATFGGALGFVNEGKNIHETIKGFAEGLARNLIPRNCALIIVGRPPLENIYRLHLENLVAATGFTNNIILRLKFVPRDMIGHVMAALDFGVLNTTGTSLSASGQVHLHAAYGTPLAAARRPIYDDACAAGALTFDVDAQGRCGLPLVDALAALAKPAVRKMVSESLRAYGQRTGWNLIARQHAEIYRRLLAKPTSTTKVDGATPAA